MRNEKTSGDVKCGVVVGLLVEKNTLPGTVPGARSTTLLDYSDGVKCTRSTLYSVLCTGVLRCRSGVRSTSSKRENIRIGARNLIFSREYFS